MSYNFKQHNKVFEHKFKYDESKHREYTTLSKLYNADSVGTVYKIDGGWINRRDKFGDRPEVVVGDFIIDMPRSLVPTFESLFTDEDAIEAINAGECKFRIRHWYSNQYFKDIYGIEFV